MSKDELWIPENLEEYGEFHKVQNKKSNRRDLHAFIRLDEWFPCDGDIVTCAAHDEIYLGISEEQIEALTQDQKVELSRCGVMYNTKYDRLFMFA